MPTLKLSLVQTATRWHDPAGNRGMFERALESVVPGTDVVVLPEMFSTGFTMSSAAVAETMAGPTVAWLRETSRQIGAALAGSLVIGENGACFNRFLWVTPDGDCRAYDKRHLFRMAGEHDFYRPGRERLIVDWRGFRVCPLVCYDLRFPVFARNGAAAGRGEYDVLLVVANWPAPRQQAWNALLRARAIENQCYVVGVNRIGRDGNGLEYRGGSAVYDWLGNARLEVFDVDGVFPVEIDLTELAIQRRDFPAWQDADAFELK